MKTKKIGIVGGMGSYATLNTFTRILDESKATNDQEFPHIIIDNNTDIPSRIEASKKKETENVLVQEINNSISLLEGAGCSKILIACNTAHLFFNRYVSKKAELINMIQEVSKRKEEGSLLVLATEPVVKAKIFDKYLGKEQVSYPDEERRKIVSEAILLLKIDKREQAKKMVERVINNETAEQVLLACTELSEIRDDITTKKKIYDVLDMSLEKLLS